MNDTAAKDENVEVRNPRFRAVVGDTIAIERIATGFLFTEGPLWHVREKYLLFSDMPGDHIRKWSAHDGSVTTFRKPCAQSNGLAWDRQGRLIVCEHATSKVTRTEADGGSTVVASHHDGKELNSPNDVVVKQDGGIYFTDPTYGRNEYFGNPRPLPRDFRGVYRADDDGKVTLLADDFGQPNGLCFALDERRLFVNDTERQHIRVFDVRDDGTLANSRVWAQTSGEGAGAPDGMKIDSAGNIYCCGPGGIHVFAPDATCIGVIRMPEYTANFCFGDDDLRSLYVTASTSIYRVRVKTPGTPQGQ